MSTLVFHHGALGDSVLLWPTLRALAPLTFVTAREKGRLAARWVQSVEPIDGDHPEFSRLFAPAASLELGDQLIEKFRGAARIVSFVSDGHDAWAANVRDLARGADLAFIRHRPPAGEVVPIVRYHAQQLGSLGWDVQPVLAGRRLNRDGPIVIHPGSGGLRKCWPPGRFDALFDYLEKMGREFVIVVGEVERETMSASVERWRDRHEVREPGDLLELSEIISRAAVFVGNDSGPTHLAAQLGVATVAMFGPSDPRIWSPVGPAVTVLWPGRPAEMSWLSVEEVAAAIARW